MKKIVFYIFVLVVFMNLKAQDALKPYEIFDKEGHRVSFETMADSLLKYDVVFFGELHNNPIAHWLQVELTSKLASLKDNEIVLGAEMFEKDNQLIVDEYLSGLIKEKTLIKDGKAWDNYKTDYAP
ncbi:MAG: ChaN family lipoprotein, partial [Flavicella sp.]|nr:ChaN family lipoprotein [Flavicella sp.]